MKLSGNNFLSVNIQTGISFNIDLSVDNLIGSCDFGFSGLNSDLRFKLNKGNIIDPNNRNAYIYTSNEQINISGNISNNLYSYYIDNQPCVLNGLTNLSNISGFYLKTNNCSADLNLSLYGDIPNYSVNFPNTFYITGNNPLIGNIYDSGAYKFQIYSGVVILPTGFSFNGFLVDGILTNSTPRDGIYTYPLQMSIGHYNQTSSQIENSRLYNLELDLYTNFGKISKIFSITGAYSGYISLDLNTSDIIYPSSGSIIGNEDETNILVNTKILSGFRSNLFELDKIITVKLEYYGGKVGTFYADISGSGYKYINVSGFLNGSGYLGKTDLILTGYNLQSGSQITGYMTGTPSEQFFITGYISNNVNILSTGYFFDIPFVENKNYNITGFTNNGLINYNNYLNSSFIQKKQTIENYISPTSQFGLKIKSNESGSIVLVSAATEINPNFSTGRVYLYTGNQGDLTLAKTYSGLLGDRNFGNNFYINKTGNCFLISCNRFGNQGDSGRVYLFENYNQNINTARIIQESGLYFAKSVAINTGNIVFINNYNGTNNTGVINIYENNGVSFVKRQMLSGYSKTNNFGTILNTVDDGQLLVASDPIASYSGEAYVFTGNNYNYSLLNKLDKSGISGISFFGYSLSLNKNGNILAVGDPYSNISSGAFFIYTGDRNNNFKQVFASGFSEPGQAQLGVSLKLNNEGNTLIAGLPLKDYQNGEIRIITGFNSTWVTTNTINRNTLNTDDIILGLTVDLSTLSGKNTYYAGNYAYQRLHTFSDINFSGYANSFPATGLINKTSNYLITGFITGNKYNKTFLNTFNLLTGYYLPSSGVYTGFIDFKENDYRYTDFYVNNDALVTSGINNLYLKVKTKNYYDDEVMTGKLTIYAKTFNAPDTGVIYYYITGKKV
jgi:hypothetical protein